MNAVYIAVYLNRRPLDKRAPTKYQRQSNRGEHPRRWLWNWLIRHDCGCFYIDVSLPVQEVISVSISVAVGIRAHCDSCGLARYPEIEIVAVHVVIIAEIAGVRLAQPPGESEAEYAPALAA